MSETFKVADYERLLASLSHRAFRRATAKGFNVEFEELFQEAKHTFVVASEGFDPSFGVKFSTYLWQAVKNNLRRVESKAINIQSKTTSMDAEIGEDVGTMHDLLPSSDESVEDRMMRLETENVMFSKLSANAKRVITILDSPPQELAKEIRRMEHFRAHCKENKMAAASRTLDVHTLCGMMGLSVNETRRIKREFKAMLEDDQEVEGPPILDESCYVCGASFACGKCHGAMMIGDIIYGKD